MYPLPVRTWSRHHITKPTTVPESVFNLEIISPNSEYPILVQHWERKKGGLTGFKGSERIRELIDIPILVSVGFYLFSLSTNTCILLRVTASVHSSPNFSGDNKNPRHDDWMQRQETAFFYVLCMYLKMSIFTYYFVPNRFSVLQTKRLHITLIF